MTKHIPGVLFHRDPAGPLRPLVIDSPHSGTEYPEDFDFSCPFDVLRMAEDTYVEELWGAAPDYGASLLGALFPRTYIDVNRDVGDIDAALFNEPWPGKLTPGKKTHLGMGLVRRLAKADLPVYRRKLTVGEVQRRIRTYYAPYHAALQALCDRAHAQFGAVWYVNSHSMPAIGTRLSSDPGARRADFVLGDRDGTTCEPAFTAFVGDFLVARGYAVKINDPYKGVELVRRHGRPTDRRHALQIEVNRSIYMDEGTLQKKPGFVALQADITALIAALAEFVSIRAEGVHRSR